MFVNAGLIHTNILSLKTHLFLSVLAFRPQNGLQSGYILKRRFRVVEWTVKTEVFENYDTCLVTWHILY